MSVSIRERQRSWAGVSEAMQSAVYVRDVLPEACPACGGPLAPWRSAPAAEPPHAPVALWRCRACGTAVTAAPAPHRALHEAGAYAPGTPRGAGLAAPALRWFD